MIILRRFLAFLKEALSVRPSVSNVSVKFIIFRDDMAIEHGIHSLMIALVFIRDVSVRPSFRPFVRPFDSKALVKTFYPI